MKKPFFYSCANWLFGFLILSACQKDDGNNHLFVIQTDEVVIEESTLNGVTFKASFVKNSDDHIHEMGFVYGLSPDPLFSENTQVIANSLVNNSFQYYEDQLLKPNLTYYVRSYVKTEKYVLYGNVVSFFSEGSHPPALSKIDPPVAFWGDTVQITGKRFGVDAQHLEVTFGDFSAKILSLYSDTVVVIVPPDIHQQKSLVQVSLYGKPSSEEVFFYIAPPEIASISKTEGKYPELIKVTGDYFIEESFTLFFGDQEITPINVDRHTFSFNVPFLGEGREVDIYLKKNDEPIMIYEGFKYQEQSVSLESADEMWADDEVILKTFNLDCDKCYSILINNRYISSSYWDVIDDVIKINLPLETYILQSAGFLLQVEVEGKLALSENIVHKLPLLESVDSNQKVYGDDLVLNVRGTYGFFTFNFQSLSDPSVSGSYSYPWVGFWGGSQNQPIVTLFSEMVPGRYQIWLTNNRGETEKMEVEVMTPQIHGLGDVDGIRSNSNIPVNGLYLPKMGEYLMKHLEDSHYFVVGSARSGSHIRMSMIGRGQYEFCFRLNDEIHHTGLVYDLDDYFSFYGSTDRVVPQLYDHFAFATNDMIVTSQTIIDLNTGMHRDVTFPDITSTSQWYPVFFHGDVVVVVEGKLNWFDYNNDRWLTDTYDFDGEWLVSACVYDGRLYAFSKGYSVFVYDGVWSKIQEGDLNETSESYFGSFAYAYDGAFYFWHPLHYINKINVSTFEIEETFRPYGQQRGVYIPQHVFVFEDEIYFCLTRQGEYNSIFMKFSPQEEKFNYLTPDFLLQRVRYYLFAPDADGHVYMLNNRDIYKFDPN